MALHRHLHSAPVNQVCFFSTYSSNVLSLLHTSVKKVSSINITAHISIQYLFNKLIAISDFDCVQCHHKKEKKSYRRS